MTDKKTCPAKHKKLHPWHMFSAEFYKLFIHLVEGNTRIAEREQFAQEFIFLMSTNIF